MKKKNDWKYCVVGNIARTPFEKDGVMRSGTPAFRGGTKIYLCGKYWRHTEETIQALGLSRGRRFYVESVPVGLIENVRSSKAFKPTVLEIMNDWENGDLWWSNTHEDKLETEAFAARWNEAFSDK